MKYTFKYTVFALGQEAGQNVFHFEGDSFFKALEAFSLHLMQLPPEDSISINSYYRCNDDYRKFRERLSFQNFINYPRGVLFNEEN